MTPPWPGSSGVTFIKMKADEHGQSTNTPRLLGRLSAWRRETQHHPCRGYTLCQGPESSLSQAWPRGKTSRCQRPTFCFTLEKKNLHFSSTDPDSCELSRVSVLNSPRKSTLVPNLHSQILPGPQRRAPENHEKRWNGTQ